MMKWFTQLECKYFLTIIALWIVWLLPILRPYQNDAVESVVWMMTLITLCWIPLSFLIHLVQEGLNLRRWIWLGALLAAILALMLVSPLNLPATVVPVAFGGIAAAPFLYILICISEAWMPWLNRPRLRAFIADLDL